MRLSTFVKKQRGRIPTGLDDLVARVASEGATPLVVAEDDQVAGVVVLEDVLKPGMNERFERLRRMGLRTVMVTGDNPLTAATIAKKAGCRRLRRAGDTASRSSITSAKSKPKAS